MKGVGAGEGRRKEVACRVSAVMWLQGSARAWWVRALHTSSQGSPSLSPTTMLQLIPFMRRHSERSTLGREGGLRLAE